jgi:hypothetical protein
MTCNYPVTDNSRKSGSNDIVITKLQLCPTGYAGSTVVSPASQTICANGLTATLTMDHDSIPSSAQPTLYRNGAANLQPPIYALYQWQEATSPGGPFTDIAGAISKNYTPSTAAVSKYYRRVAYYICDGVKTTIRNGDTASVLVSSNTAPTVDAGTNRFVCPGTAVVLGGSPTATPVPGGAGIASYLWTPAGAYVPNNTAANPTITPAASTIYTVLVTDSNGCRQEGQVSITVAPNPAGPDVSLCEGSSVRIGTQPFSANGVTYSWTSSPAGFTSTEAQPLVLPAVTTTYILTVTIPLQGGGTCSYSDSVVVTVVLSPKNNGGNFAGNDQTICRGTATTVGATGADVGFTYVWAPGNFLTSISAQRPTFNAGSFMPNPDPFTYYLTATKSGCRFVDTVRVFVLKADAGLDGCGPRIIGTPDETPNINETYAWTLVSGTASFLGPTNLPQIVVGATNATYRLSVTYNGVTCTDDVVVTPCGTCPIMVESGDVGCPSYSLNGGLFDLSGSSSDYAYIWSTTGGVTLSNYTGQTVSVTNGNNGTVSFTAVNIYDTTIVCTAKDTVNNPAWSLPVFTATDTSTCPGVAVQIGALPIAGYTYQWNSLPPLSNTLISNPMATTLATTNYVVVVTDTGSGCSLRDTSTVTIPGLPPNAAGNSFTICGPLQGYSWVQPPCRVLLTAGPLIPPVQYFPRMTVWPTQRWMLPPPLPFM